jgi:hypothetical protein
MLNWLPKHDGGLILQHNDHRTIYQSAEEWIEDNSKRDISIIWVSEKEKQLAIENDSIWLLQWYPDTPVGFYCVCASTLGALQSYFLE